MAKDGTFSSRMENGERPFFGRTRQVIDRIRSLDEEWYVEFSIIKYFFMGIEVYSHQKEVVRYVNTKPETATT